MNNFETLQHTIENRRNINPSEFNDKKIADDDIRKIIAAANWAPTHGRTEPWRLIVLSGNGTANFGKVHADLYKENTPEERFLEGTYDKLQKMAEKSSHIIVVYNHRGTNPNIPEVEEICATSCAIQNMLLTAESLDIASFWSTGGQITKPSVKKHFNLADTDIVLAVLFFGYTDKEPLGKRNTSIEEKTQWENQA